MSLMANPNKARGTRWETAVVNFLRLRTGRDVPVFRPRQEGHADSGDVHVDADFVLQCKDWERWSRGDLFNFVDDAQLQAIHAGRPWGAACVKRRRGKGSTGSVETGLVVMPLDIFAEIVHDLSEGREAIAALEERTDE